MNKRLNDVAPSEWDRASRTGLEPWMQPDGYDTERPSLDDCTLEIECGEDEEEELDRYDNGYALKVSKEDVDAVNNPDHYNTGNIECIEAIEESMSSVAFKGYLKGNCMKYLWRYDYKGKSVEDLQKAGWYLNKLTEMVTEENT